MTPHEWGLLLALALLWGASFFFVGVAVRELPPLTIVMLRVGLAALILLAVVGLTGLPMPTSRQVWSAFIGMGLLNNAIPFSLFVWGQGYIASALAAILNATTPFLTLVVAHLLTRDEKITTGRLAGLLVGFTGVIVMVGGAALHGLGANLVAQFACLAAALCYAFAGVFGRRFAAMGVQPLQTATGQVVASSLILLPLVAIVDRPWTLPAPSAATMAAIAGLAALSTGLAYVLYFRILATAGATNLLLVTFLVPVSAIVLGTLVLGLGLIAIGLAAIDGRPWRAAKRRFARVLNGGWKGS
jgi:drug/metabolite transporter (DMT)-like permease